MSETWIMSSACGGSMGRTILRCGLMSTMASRTVAGAARAGTETRATALGSLLDETGATALHIPAGLTAFGKAIEAVPMYFVAGSGARELRRQEKDEKPHEAH